MAETLEEIIYNESVRAITAQSQMLDELRSRAGTLLSAAAIATSFLGAQALHSHSLKGSAWVAVLAFAGCMVAALLVLVPPLFHWSFVTSARNLIEGHVDRTPASSSAELHRFLAESLEDAYDGNVWKITVLQGLFWLGAILLSVEMIAWLIDLGRM